MTSQNASLAQDLKIVSIGRFPKQYFFRSECVTLQKVNRVKVTKLADNLEQRRRGIFQHILTCQLR